MSTNTAPVTLQKLAADIRTVLSLDPSAAAKQHVCRLVERALHDVSFVETHLKDRELGADPREVLYEDPELGFCICGHVYMNKALGKPHDHGTSWAIYGQATGVTEMTDWRIVEQASGDRPTLVEPARTYNLAPGQAHFYDVGAVHSPKREDPVKLIRIEGRNLDHERRSNIKAK